MCMAESEDWPSEAEAVLFEVPQNATMAAENQEEVRGRYSLSFGRAMEDFATRVHDEEIHEPHTHNGTDIVPPGPWGVVVRLESGVGKVCGAQCGVGPMGPALRSFRLFNPTSVLLSHT